MPKVESKAPSVPVKAADLAEAAEARKEAGKSRADASHVESPELQGLARRRAPRAPDIASGSSAPRLARLPVSTDKDSSDSEHEIPAETHRTSDEQMSTGVRIAQVVANAASLVWKGSVGALAVSAGYRVARNPGDLLSHPVNTMAGIVTFGERVTEQTVQQGRADVLDRYGGHIPADSACHDIEPRVSHGLPHGVSGRVTRGSYPPKDTQPVDLQVNRYVPMGGALHVAHHEYMHCYTHPTFVGAVSNSPHWREIEEMLTEHFADQLPGHAIGKFSSYDLAKFPDGKRWSKAVAELEAAVGTETLHRAYFGGDAGAVKSVSKALVDILPKAPTNTAWQAFRWVEKSQRKSLAECFVGAALLSTGRLPPEARRGSDHKNPHAVDRFRRLDGFGQITPTQSEAMLQQAQALRSTLGEKFDQAFFGFHSDAQLEAMNDIKDQIHAAWKKVL